MSRAPIRVLCVDDHPIVIEGISLIINRQSDMTVVGSAGSVRDAVASFRRDRPDVTVMDLQLRHESGCEAISEIRSEAPDARIVVLTVSDGEEDIFRALDAGAAAYVLKDDVPQQLVHVVRIVHQGDSPPLRPELQETLAKRVSRRSLTTREMEVLDLISQGLRNKEIGAVLGIADETVRAHVKNLFAKLEAKDRTAAVRVGVHRGIIRLR